MSSTVFTDQTTIVVAAWLNDINSIAYNILGNGTVIPATAAAARTNLGLGTIATQAASAVTITGGTIAGVAITGSTYTGNITGNASGTAASITGVNPVSTGGTNLSTTTAYSPVLTGTTATGTFKADLGPGTAGQVLISAGPGAYPAWTTPSAGVIQGTAQNSTSGTSIDFTGIPSGIKRIIVSFSGVSTSGTNNILFQLGTSGGIETTGYLGSGTVGANAASPSVNLFTVGFGLLGASAANVYHGQLVLTLVSSSSNTWAASGNLALSNAAAYLFTAGNKALVGTLDRVRITTVGGTDTFDAGVINIQYE